MSSLVSILIPAYRAERWIRETIASAASQTWRKKEIIVIDDGSPDGTFDAARSMESRDIKVVRQANTGACGARNRLLSLAQGDYIQWLDADDLLHPEKISRQLAAAEDGTKSLTLLTCAWGKFFFRPERAEFTRDALWKDLEPVDWIVAKFAENVWMNPAVWLVSRRLTDLAGPWNERLTISGDDDGEYVCRVVARSAGVHFVEDANCYYRIGNVGSLNWNMEKSDKSLGALVLSLKLTIGHLLGMEDSERTRSAALRYLHHFLPYFYGAPDEPFRDLAELAGAIGGELKPPTPGWKYYPVELAFGPRVTRKVINNWRAAKMLARGKWDRYLYRLTR